MGDRLWETSLLTLLSNCKLKDINKNDEFAWFYECLLKKIYQLRSENCSGGKLSKIHITDLVVTNAIGDKLPMFVTGKA